jgi:putative membrane protein
MIRSYNDHAANERTFLAWVRTGLSAITLGIIVEKGSLASLAITNAPSPGHTREYLGGYSGLVLVGIGIAVVLGASIRFIRTALLIDDDSTHSAAVVRAASALLRRRRQEHGTVKGASACADSCTKRTSPVNCIGRMYLPLVASTEVSQIDPTERAVAREIQTAA